MLPVALSQVRDENEVTCWLNIIYWLNFSNANITLNSSPVPVSTRHLILLCMTTLLTISNTTCQFFKKKSVLINFQIPKEL